jgi:hypothetical protein
MTIARCSCQLHETLPPEVPTHAKSSISAKAASGLRGIPPLLWILAAEVPEYHDWVKQGGLNDFAKRMA